MARDFEVVFMESTRRAYKAPVDGVYQVRKDRPAQWLQRACAWVLDKLGAVYLDDRETIERRVVRPDGLMQAIYQQRGEVFQTLGRGGETLVIGAQDYMELMREDSALGYMSFRAEYHTGPREVMGLTVKVVPWMRGLVVLP